MPAGVEGLVEMVATDAVALHPALTGLAEYEMLAPGGSP